MKCRIQIKIKCSKIEQLVQNSCRLPSIYKTDRFQKEFIKILNLSTTCNIKSNKPDFIKHIVYLFSHNSRYFVLLDRAWSIDISVQFTLDRLTIVVTRKSGKTIGTFGARNRATEVQRLLVITTKSAKDRQHVAVERKLRNERSRSNWRRWESKTIAKDSIKGVEGRKNSQAKKSRNYKVEKVGLEIDETSRSKRSMGNYESMSDLFSWFPLCCIHLCGRFLFPSLQPITMPSILMNSGQHMRNLHAHRTIVRIIFPLDSSGSFPLLYLLVWM